MSVNLALALSRLPEAPSVGLLGNNTIIQGSIFYILSPPPSGKMTIQALGGGGGGDDYVTVQNKCVKKKK